jgi:hypothetical protein
MHILVGQDTDSESNVLEANMPWIAKLDKDDFVGKWSLEHVQERGLEELLVGFEMETARCRSKARRSSSRHAADRPDHELALEPRARQGDRDGLGAAEIAEEGKSFLVTVDGRLRAATRAAAPVLRSRRGEAALVSDSPSSRPAAPRGAVWRSPLERALAAPPGHLATSRSTGKIEIRGDLPRLGEGRRARADHADRGLVLCDFTKTVELLETLSRTTGHRRERDAGRALGPRRGAHAADHRPRPRRAAGAGAVSHVQASSRATATPSRSGSARSTRTTSPRSSSTQEGPAAMKDIFRVRRMWRPRAELKDRYDVVIVGGGSHGLATAYYLAKNHGITDVAVLEKNYIGSGAAGRNTTIIRANYRTPEGAEFYKASVKLYEGRAPTSTSTSSSPSRAT